MLFSSPIAVPDLDVPVGVKNHVKRLLPPANEVWGKVICLQVCVCPRGGGLVPGGCLVLGVVWSRGCLVLGGSGPGEGGLVWERAVPGGNPPKRLLLRAVRILLECILVYI